MIQSWTYRICINLPVFNVLLSTEHHSKAPSTCERASFKSYLQGMGFRIPQMIVDAEISLLTGDKDLSYWLSVEDQDTLGYYAQGQ